MLNTTARQNTTPRTVLVVEDEPTLATAIAQRITAEGWTARVAGDGASAVQAASQLRPDLVIMDIILPVMDGLEATKRIVAERPVPVLILTARDDEADKVIGLGAGADDYMTKPFSMRELIARCKALLRRVERAKVIAKNSENEKLLDAARSRCSPAKSCSKRSGTGSTHPAPAPSTATSRRCAISSVPIPSAPCMAWATLSSRRPRDGIQKTTAIPA